MSSFSLSPKSDSTNLAVPKLRDDGSNWVDYEPRIQKAMGAKGLWRHVEGKASEPKHYAMDTSGTYVLTDGKTPATEEQVESKEAKIEDFEKKHYLAQHIILSTTSTRLSSKIKNMKSAPEMWRSCSSCETSQHCSLMTKYDDKTLDPIPPTLAPGEKEHVLVPQDETTVHTNEGLCRQWLKGDQQPLKKKGNGRGIHISDWICETTGRLALSPEQIATQSELSEALKLKVMDAHKIIYPGKNHDAWWDLNQLLDQTKNVVNIFEYLHPDKVRIWVFDCSSAHKGLATDALYVNNMNVNPGGKQRHMHTTVIPLSNTPPKPGHNDTHGMVQDMGGMEDCRG